MNSGMNVATPQSDDWETPPWLFRALDSEFSFTLDPCATIATAKCRRFYTLENDGLTRPWDGRQFVNPPYSGIHPWVWRAIHTTTLSVLLLPVRSDNDWWELVQPYKPRYFRKRIAFLLNGVEQAGPRFPSMLVVIR
jgi:site-specific DNA-methyltransferase (adenine-specific)